MNEYIFISIYCLFTICCATLVFIQFYIIRKKKKQYDITDTNKASLLLDIIQSTHDLIFVFDYDLNILEVFRSKKSDLLYPQKNLIGKNYKELVNDKDLSFIQKNIKECIKTQECIDFKYNIERNDQIIYFEGRLVYLKKNKIAYVIYNISNKKKEAEYTLKEQEAFLKNILDNIPFPLALKDVDNDFRYTYINKRFTEGVGFTSKDIIGKNDFELYDEKVGKQFRESDIATLKNGFFHNNDEIFTSANGTKYDTVVSKKLILNGMKRIILIIRWDISDITKVKKNLELLNKLNQIILENTNTGLVYITPDYYIAKEYMSQYRNIPILKEYKEGYICYKKIYQRETPCENCIVMEAIQKKIIIKKEVIDTQKNNTLKYIATPIFDENSESQGVVLRIDNITERKKYENRLVEAKKNAENSDQLKSAFLANMSHEIRTPLNLISGFSELLIESDNEEDKNEYIKIIKNNNELLLQLINDILDLSKIESNTLDFVYSDVDINEMLHELEKSYQMKMNNSPVIIHSSIESENLVINTDKNRIRQVLTNLINNAIKFTSKGKIEFGYRLLEEEIYFYVLDTGMGIPEHLIDNVFDRFVRLDKQKKGTGLGLAICKTIIDHLQGEIGVSSKLNVGSTFWFKLPINVIKE